jgi:hypothetical protein
MTRRSTGAAFWSRYDAGSRSARTYLAHRPSWRPGHQRRIIAISGNRIAGIGRREALPAGYAAAQTIELAGRLVTPGYVNVHTHAVLSLMRGIALEMGICSRLHARRPAWPRHCRERSRDAGPARCSRSPQLRIDDHGRQLWARPGDAAGDGGTGVARLVVLAISPRRLHHRSRMDIDVEHELD